MRKIFPHVGQRQINRPLGEADGRHGLFRVNLIYFALILSVEFWPASGVHIYMCKPHNLTTSNTFHVATRHVVRKLHHVSALGLTAQRPDGLYDYT